MNTSELNKYENISPEMSIEPVCGKTNLVYKRLLTGYMRPCNVPKLAWWSYLYNENVELLHDFYMTFT